MTHPPTFGALLSAAMDAAGLDTVGLATRLRASRQTVNRWQRDVMLPKRHKMPALCRALGVPESYFTPGVTKPPTLIVRVGRREAFRVAITEAVTILVAP